MKNLSRIFFCFALCVLLTACGQSVLNPTPMLSPSPTITPKPSETSTPTIEPTPSRVSAPTARPIIEETQITKLLETSFSIEASKALDGHDMRKITGWEYGFQDYAGGGFENGPSYQWLDVNHLLLHPIIGDVTSSITHSKTLPAVINLDTSNIWIPISDEEWNYEYYLPHWSPKLQILITAKGDNISTYNSDGDLLETYKGKLDGVSPSGTKILLKGGMWIDLVGGKKVTFGWSKYSLRDRWRPVWSPNEDRVYRCCYLYGDANTGESFMIPEDEILLDGKPVQGYLNASSGVWIGNNFLLPQMRWEDTDPYYSLGFIPLFDPSAKTFRNLINFAGLPPEFNNMYLSISASPNGDYLFVSRPTYEVSYLVNLKTHEIQQHTTVSWSAHGKFMFVDSQVLTLANNELRTVPEPPGLSKKYSVTNSWTRSWHPIKEVVASIFTDEQQEQTLILFDVETLSYQTFSLPSEFYDAYSDSTKIIWNPKGDRMVLATADGSLWQLDYPNLQNLEQLTPLMPKVKDIFWSPDGTYISFVSDKDIYVVDTNINP